MAKRQRLTPEGFAQACRAAKTAHHLLGWNTKELGEMVEWLLRERQRLSNLSEGWRDVAGYYMGDYVDSHTPAQAREEAIRRILPRPPVRRG